MNEEINKPDDSIKIVRNRLGINRSKDEITSEIRSSIDLHNTILGPNGTCMEYPMEIYPEKYFIAQEFNDTKQDFRSALEDALKQFGFTSIRADDFIWTGPVICKICGLIQGTPFGIYQLSDSQNRNVYLELGIAMGLGRPFVLVKDKGAVPAELVEDIEYYQLNSYLETRYKLGGLLEKYIANIGSYIPRMSNEPVPSNTVLISNGKLQPIEISVSIAKMLKNLGYTPIILGKFDATLVQYLSKYADVAPMFAETRDEIVKAIQTSAFGVYRIDKLASADNFVALGIALGLNRRFFPICNKNGDIPSDLNGLSPLSFSGYTDLENNFAAKYNEWHRKW